MAKNIIPILALGVLILIWSTLGSSSSGLDLDDVKLVLQRSAEMIRKYEGAAPEYDYLETDKHADGRTKTFQELMILGSRYERLVAVNGIPLSPPQEAQEQRKLEATIARRRNESQEERVQRLAKEEEIRKRNYALIEQIPAGFDFAYVGQQQLAGRDVYVLKATPKVGYRPVNRETQVLEGMQGQLWIDKETYNWVKVEAECIRPVSIVGYLARVEPGTRFELEMRPLSDGVWMPSHFAMKARAKVFFFFNHESSDDESYSEYHKATQY